MAQARLGWAIAGTGRIARRFAEDMRLSQAGRVSAVASRDADRARRFAAAVGPDVAFGNLDAVAARPNVGAVYVAGRNEDHAEQALRCLAAGKPVLVEKPFAMNEADAERVRRAAQDSGILCMEAMWMRFTPGIRRLKALIDAGEIGDLRSIEASLAFRNPHPDASVLFDLGVYPVSLAIHLLGRPDDIVSAGDDRQAGIVLVYPEAAATLSCSFRADGPNTLAITGRTGVLTTDAPFICPSMLTLRRTGVIDAVPQNDVGEPLAIRPRLPWMRSAKAMTRPLRARRTLVPYVGNGLHYQADHFAECLAVGLRDSPIMPLADSLETIRVVAAAEAHLARAYPSENGSGAKVETGR